MQDHAKIVDIQKFKNVMGRFTTGVTVVSVSEGGAPHGMTVNSFTSVSLEPLLVLVCLDKSATTTEILSRTRRYTVNILSESQMEIAQRFATPVEEESRFEGLSYTISEEGTPILKDILGYVTCIVTDVVEAGDHFIFIGEVTDLDYTDDNKKPLLYYRGAYKSLADNGLNYEEEK